MENCEWETSSTLVRDMEWQFGGRCEDGNVLIKIEGSWRAPPHSPTPLTIRGWGCRTAPCRTRWMLRYDLFPQPSRRALDAHLSVLFAGLGRGVTSNKTGSAGPWCFRCPSRRRGRGRCCMGPGYLTYRLCEWDVCGVEDVGRYTRSTSVKLVEHECFRPRSCVVYDISLVRIGLLYVPPYRGCQWGLKLNCVEPCPPTSTPSSKTYAQC